MINLEGVILTPLKIINVSEGDVFHGMKSIDNGFKGFGEAYFSSIKMGMIKAWKRHHIMTLNIIVPIILWTPINPILAGENSIL